MTLELEIVYSYHIATSLITAMLFPWYNNISQILVTWTKAKIKPKVKIFSLK